MGIVTDEQMVMVRSIHGVPVCEFTPNQLTSAQWGRELQQVSQCSLTTPSLLDGNGNFLDIVPWLHWVDVWSTDWNPVLYWSGPIQKVGTDQFSGQISAVDVGALLARQRCPITESWNSIDPSIPALAAWQAMLAQQGIFNVVPIQRNNPWGQLFNITLTTDVETLDKTMGELEQMGLYWSVNAGVPLLGPMPLEPIGSLGLAGFQNQGPQVIRDGSTVYNDVLVRGPDNLANAKVPLDGLSLQTIVNVDTMFSLTNVNVAAERYVLYTGAFRTEISTPSSAVLIPDAPVNIATLVPTARYAVDIFGVRTRMQLSAMQCSVSSGVAQVAVTLTEVPNWTEINKYLQAGGAGSLTSGGSSGIGTGQASTSSVVGQQVGAT
jgi:hypothetical protein